MKDLISENLKCFNDSNFKFDPKYHKYTYHGKQFTSVTKFISQFHEPFKQDYWSKIKADEAGVPQEWILKEWKDKNDYANAVGTSTHQWIENYFNNLPQTLPTNLDIVGRINKFNTIFAKHLYKLDPVKFEVRVFSKKWLIAGTIDSLFLYKGKIYIIDWKTNSDFKDDNHPKGRYQKLLFPFESFYQNHLNEYSIQLSLYALILEEWGFKIGGSYIVHIGPETEACLYKTIDMRNHLKAYLK